MAWSAVYRQTDGALVSVGESVAAALPAGLAVKALPTRPDFATQRWNPATLALEALAPVVIRDRADDIEALPEIAALTAAKRANLRTGLSLILDRMEGRFYA